LILSNAIKLEIFISLECLGLLGEKG